MLHGQPGIGDDGWVRIVVAGSSGFLGTHLVDHLTGAGHQVLRLVRRATRGPAEIRWDPNGGVLDASLLAGVEAVVNLAGANVGGRRWSPGYKREILNSRVYSTTTLARALATAADRPATLLNSSAVGFYGDTGDRPVDEESPAGDDFLAHVCQAWESATAAATRAGVRVVRMRTGLPLDRSGGLLKPLLLPFRAGVGGRLGSGRQYLPWIALADWLGAVEFLLDRADITGPVNLVGPAPTTNAEFTRELAAMMHRPALLPVPRIALRALLGEFGGETVASQRVLPGVLTRAGFAWTYPTLPEALRRALEDRPDAG